MEYLAGYIAPVPDGPILETLEREIGETAKLVERAGEARGGHRYAPGKWSVKEVVGHVADTERVFAYRALSFARGDATPLPGFEQDDWVAAGDAEARTVASLVAELRSVRAATLTLFAGFSDEAWGRSGTASGFPVPVVAFPWVIAGHELHHRRILVERYGL